MAGPRVWLWANTLSWPEGGGHLWVYLNWALGLRACGAQVTWLEAADLDTPPARTAKLVASLKSRLARYGFGVAIWPAGGGYEGTVPLDAADGADLLLNFCYHLGGDLLPRFRRTALLDIDPGLLQVWLSEGQVQVAPHDLYFTIGETVGAANSKIPDCGIDWIHTLPCVSLEHWPVTAAARKAEFTTVSNWSTSKEWVVHGGESYHNDKRSGFEPFFELPRHTRQRLTLAICQAADERLRLAAAEKAEKKSLERIGWRIVHAQEVSSTPWDYQHFVQSSRGEFSCVKPSCVRLQNAWVSDRTLCYLASGKPAVVQHTGSSRILPDDAGVFRFHDLAGAARCLETAAADYDRQCRLARWLAEEWFDARKVARRLLERAID